MNLRVIRKFGAWLLLAATLGLVSCGGGEQVSPFMPGRVLAFGDETNVLDSAGRNYAINGLNATTGALDCTLYPIWVQSIATAYGKVFPECNPNNVATTSRIVATPGAKVADFTTQIDNFIAGGDAFKSTDLVLVYVGMNDVWEQYALYPTTPLATLRTELTARGKALAAQINRIAALDGRVVVGKLHDLSYTPYSVTETQNNPDTADGTRQQVIRALVLAFNDGFFADLNNDAQHIGLFDPDQNLGTIILNPGNIGLTSATAAACQTTAVLPNCNTGTLVTGATATTYLYADDRHLAYQGHLQFSALAYSRANNNPF